MKSKYDYDTIRDYLHGLVDKDTARNIRELIRTDEVAQNIAVGILRLEHDFKGDDVELEAYIDMLLQKQLSTIQNEGKRSNRTWVRLAAAILLLVVAAPLLWLTLFQGDGLALVDRELTDPYPLSSLSRGPEDTSAVAVAFGYYAQGDYKKAIESFDKITTEDAGVIFYKGLSYLYSGDYDNAVSQFRSMPHSESRYVEQTLWYLSLSHIKAGDNDDARISLEIIAGDPSHYKNAEAIRLLKELD